ncbi:hypothetical protein L873DRAFT_914037 [Choiromyces venosus 120613-1]|uniref:Helicase C-terminal domain-containing protein n=1 Tax=Choiromyces venosus 120613-1 TaxID=1336337 RepID=A0A3N4ITH4_9PEZI|nr:hypothetical protein L873DRAFT_914037 [Choiromyces venosus 120613-1]
MLEQWHELFQGTRGATRDLMVNIYRRCRIASSVPALCSIAAFKNGNWDRANVASYRTAGTRAQSPYSGHLDTIIRLSPKLLWLRDFIANQLGSSPEAPDEKLLIFSFSPVVLHCVDLCLDKWNISVGSAWAAPPDTRALMFEEFQKADNPRVLTGTYGTMGEGATLIRAFRCILLDPDWEISKENQAIGRIHRCGQ